MVTPAGPARPGHPSVAGSSGTRSPSTSDKYPVSTPTNVMTTLLNAMLADLGLSCTRRPAIGGFSLVLLIRPDKEVLVELSPA